jgi:hypothetical protein
MKNMEKILMPPPIEIEIQDIDGKSIVLVAKSISRKTMSEITKAAQGDSSDALNNQMAVLFGGQMSDYDNVDIRVIKRVLERVTEEITGKANPT